MIEAEADALKILSKMTKAAEAPMETDMREGALGGDSVITFAVAELEKDNLKKSAKKMTEVEADALNILSKATEAAEAPTEKEMIEGVLKTREGSLGGDIVIAYAVAEVPRENSKSLRKI